MSFIDRSDWKCIHPCDAFSLVEVLVAVSIIVIALLGTTGGFNFVTRSIKKSSGFGEIQVAIDNDVARIKQITRVYTPCNEPRGEAPAQEDFPICGVSGPADITPDYYFPAGGQEDVNSFFDACGPASAGVHFTAAFIAAIDVRGDLPDEVTKNVEREDASDGGNHNVIVTYSSARLPYPRRIVVAPAASSWCP